LLASEPILGSMGLVAVPTWLPFVFVIPLPLPSPMRLKREKTPSTEGSLTSPPVPLFCATRLLMSLSEGSVSRQHNWTMPPASVAVLRATVLLMRLTSPLRLEIPPPKGAELPETVLFVSVTLECSRTMTSIPIAPPRLLAELPEMVLRVTVSVPTLWKIPRLRRPSCPRPCSA
jgi:hypothetical protein